MERRAGNRQPVVNLCNITISLFQAGCLRSSKKHREALWQMIFPFDSFPSLLLNCGKLLFRWLKSTSLSWDPFWSVWTNNYQMFLYEQAILMKTLNQCPSRFWIWHVNVPSLFCSSPRARRRLYRKHQLMSGLLSADPSLTADRP